MVMPRSSLIPLLMTASLLGGRLSAVPIHVLWPDGAGTYSIRTATPKNFQQGTTYELGENEQATLYGPGFSVSFAAEKGHIQIPVDYEASNPGVHFDPKTNTFSFATFPVRVAVKDFSDAVALDAKPLGLTDTSVNLIAGRHVLDYGKNRLPFDVQADGYVLLLGDIHGISARGPVITVQGTVSNEVAMPPAPRQAGKDQELHDRVLDASEKARWKTDFPLAEKLGLWNFAEQQISYPVAIPAEIETGSLALLAFTDSTVRVVSFQFGGNRSTIFFRTDLPRNAHRLFRLVSSFDTKEIPAAIPNPPALTATVDLHEALLDNGLLTLKVPAGHRDFPGGKSLAEVPAPILSASREGHPEAVRETFAAPGSLKVAAMDAKMIESGPVFAKYQITYLLQGEKSYSTMLELRAGESHVAISESVQGFTPNDQAFLHLDYGKGLLDPNRRLVAGIGAGTDHGYDRYSGAYDRHASTDDRFRPWILSFRWLDYDPKLDNSKVPFLDFRLGLFIPNTLGVVHAATFFRDSGPDALLLAIDRPEEWKTYDRWLWTDYRSADNLRFYIDHDRKYMATELAGKKRSWALGVIPRSDVVMRAMDKVPAGPEVWLSTQLGIWNLQAQKDRQVEWDEKLDTPPPPNAAMSNETPPKTPVPMTYDEYVARYLDKYVVRDMVNFGPFFGYLNGRSFPVYYDAYLRSRAAWTPEQRERIRQILVFLTDYNDGDDYQPSHSMLGGHPNFENDAKQNVVLGLASFPQHPKAKVWRDSFLAYFDEFLDKCERKDVPELNTKGGRWTENIACYWGQSMIGILNSQRALKSYDGTTLANNPRLRELIHWMRDAMMSPHDGQRMVPPEGAHSYSFHPGSVAWKSLFELSAELATVDPRLAQDMHWIETGGKEGVTPDVRSALYTDYGVVFHYDFGGAHESYAHLQDINGMSYRWGYAGPLCQAGLVYYGAKNKVWSYNGGEADGDDFDWEKVTALTVNGHGLSAGSTDQLLYDFDFAQFYRQPGQKDDAYRARALMLVRDDYLVVSDEMKSPETSATFRWVNLFDLPEIYQLKPGAKMEESTFADNVRLRPGETERMYKRRIFSGQGDFLTLVAPAPVTATATPYGATVMNGEYIFASQKSKEIKQGQVVFSGTYGYARANQLALFQGTKIGLEGFSLMREGGDFGISAVAEPGKIIGRIVGRSGGKVFIVPPGGQDKTKASVAIAGQPVPHTIERGAIAFPVEITQREGLKNYEIVF